MVQIEALKAVGVDEVVLAINYQPEVLNSALFQNIIEVRNRILSASGLLGNNF